MSAFPVRSSILQRPVRTPQPGAPHPTTTHLETEHSRAEAKLQYKRELRQQREHVRGQRLWGDQTDKAELAAAERAEQEALLTHRAQMAEEERRRSEKLKQEIEQREADVRQAELAKIERKREYLAQLRDENRRLAEQRAHIQRDEREEEKAHVQQNAGHTFLDKFGRHAY